MVKGLSLHKVNQIYNNRIKYNDYVLDNMIKRRIRFISALQKVNDKTLNSLIYLNDLDILYSIRYSYFLI